MDVATETAPDASGLPLEAVEFDLALSSRDIVECGFETAVRDAAEKSGAVFLFQMPVIEVEDTQRIAALRVGEAEERHTVLVHLRADGVSFRVEDAAVSESPFAGIALSFGGVLDCLDGLESIAA